MYKNRNSKNTNEVIAGKNPVLEALKSGRAIDSILISRGSHGAIAQIVAQAKKSGIPVKEVDPKKLDFMCSGVNHQGVVAISAVCKYSEMEDIFNLAKQRNELPFIIIADEIEDPHNLGAIIRTAECAGAHGVIVSRRRAVGLTYAVGKASAGALEYLPVVRVTNIAASIDYLKEQGLWIYGADMCGENWCESDLKGSVGLVIGNEGNGISRLVKEKCDVILSLPLRGNINSLNASVAAGVIMYEISRQRLGIKAK